MEERSGTAYGFMAFASTLMVIGGGFQVLSGVSALFSADTVPIAEGWLFKMDTTTWGWIHLGLGILMIGAGLALVRGVIWARLVGIVLAGVTTLAGFAWAPHHPVWGLLIIGVSIGVIWALTIHGGEFKDQEPNA